MPHRAQKHLARPRLSYITQSAVVKRYGVSDDFDNNIQDEGVIHEDNHEGEEDCPGHGLPRHAHG